MVIRKKLIQAENYRFQKEIDGMDFLGWLKNYPEEDTLRVKILGIFEQ